MNGIQDYQKLESAQNANPPIGTGKEKPNNSAVGHGIMRLRGALSHAWRGGTITNSRGYKMVYMPDHQRAGAGSYIKEHVLVAEKVLGKPLSPKTIVHHVDGVCGKRKPNEIVICQNQGYHMLLHRRKRAYDNCGHAGWRKCQFCKKYDDPKNLYLDNWGHARHRSCRNKHQHNKNHGYKNVNH